MKMFLTLGEMETYETQLLLHPVILNKSSYRTKMNSVWSMFNEIIDIIGASEDLLTEDHEEAWWETHRLNDVRAKIYGSRPPTNGAQTRAAAYDLAAISGAEDLQTLIDDTAYQDVLSEAQAPANYDRLVAEFLSELTAVMLGYMIDNEHGQAASPTMIDNSGKIYDLARQITEKIRELHLIYFEITNNTSPQILAGLNYNLKFHIDAGVTNPANQFEMNDWILAFDKDIAAVQHAITWRS